MKTSSVNHMTVSLCHHMAVLLVLTAGLVSFHVTDSVQGLTPILNNSGPAVVGSNLTFHAVLYGCNDTSANLSRFTYVWTNTAQTMTNKLSTRGGCSSQISLHFAVDVPGLYTMSVMVKDETESFLECFELCVKGLPTGLATTVFNLTGELNGDIVLKHANHSPHVHLTHTPVSFGVDVTDQVTNATFTYTWRVNGTERTTHTPTYNYTFHQAGWHTVAVLVNMSTTRMQGVNIKRYGVFQKSIQLKDAVSKLTYSGDRTFPVGHYLKANISWTGSAPFRLSWCLRGISGYVHHSPTIIVPRHVASIDVPLHVAGEFNLTIDIVNNWSTGSRHEKITVFTPEAGTSVFLVLLCIVIGIGVVTATGIAYRRDRELSQRHLEVADFSFHSHSTPSVAVGHCVAALRLKWRHLWTSHVSRGVSMDSYNRL